MQIFKKAQEVPENRWGISGDITKYFVQYSLNQKFQKGEQSSMSLLFNTHL